MKKAFTLIELLIVIAILGILAVGILIALDPVEQTRRASDSTVQQSAVEVKDAINRYYASKLYFPWCLSTSPAGGCSPVSGCNPNTAYLLDAGCGSTVITELQNVGELKSALPNTITSVLNLALGPSATSFQTSFVPTSKSLKSNPNTKWTAADCAASTCTVSPTSSCYFCIQ